MAVTNNYPGFGRCLPAILAIYVVVRFVMVLLANRAAWLLALLG